MMRKAYGSGNFGEWFTDEFHLPAYRYTCNQLEDSKAVTLTNDVWRSPTDHSHQIGNDRITGVVSNYGVVQVRQDEGAPKFLNDYAPEENQFAGGFGYLTDGKTTLSTYYPGNAESFERIFGMGYFRKIISDQSYRIDQVIFAPFGDDPVLVSQVTITNLDSIPASLRWTEYWGARQYQFSFRRSIYAYFKDNITSARKFRQQFARRFKHSFRPIGRQGILDTQSFGGYLLSDRLRWSMFEFLSSTVLKKKYANSLVPPVKNATYEDLKPPATFLILLNDSVDGMATDGNTFFGKGGVASPDGLPAHLNSTLTPHPGDDALLLQKDLQLAPGESKILYFLYGYLPEGNTPEQLMIKYQDSPETLLEKSCQAWAQERIEVTLPGNEWIDRELHWHQYYLRSALSYDSFFKEHILSQGCNYQYIVGIQAASRDPVQHILPLIFTSPEIVKEVIRYTLKSARSNGSLPWGMAGHGMWMPSHIIPSDLQLWTLWAASEYILAWKDTAFLEEQISTYPVYGGGAEKKTVLEMLVTFFNYQVGTVGTGAHGLQRLANGDWNDSVIIGYLSKEELERVRPQAESVLNAGMAAYIFDLFAEAMVLRGETALAQQAREKAKAQRLAVRDQFTGRWFKRAWLKDNLWIGEDVLCLEPQPWALISGSATPEQARTLVDNIDTLLRKPSQFGAMLNRGLPRYVAKPGIAHNGGIVPAINGPLVWGLSLIDPAMAWDEWMRNSLSWHAETFPDLWYGIWSGSDFYNSDLSPYPGSTVFPHHIIGHPEEIADRTNAHRNKGISWSDFPVMNMHPHAWTLYSLTKFLGIHYTSDGLEITPRFPMNTYRFASPLVGLERTGDGYQGWYNPRQDGEWKISIMLSGEEGNNYHLADEYKTTIQLEREDGKVILRGKKTSGHPIRWQIVK